MYVLLRSAALLDHLDSVWSVSSSMPWFQATHADSDQTGSDVIAEHDPIHGSEDQAQEKSQPKNGPCIYHYISWRFFQGTILRCHINSYYISRQLAAKMVRAMHARSAMGLTRFLEEWNISARWPLVQLVQVADLAIDEGNITRNELI